MRRVLEALEQRAIKVTKAEVDRLITDARSSIQAYIEDSAAVDELRHSQALLQKIANVLKIMQVHGGVLLANEASAVLQKLIDAEIENIEGAQDVVSRAIVRLGDYLEHVEAGNKDVPLVLMPLLNDMRASRGAALLSENVLFFPDLDNIQLPKVSFQPSDNDVAWQTAVRAKFQRALLDCVNKKNIPSAAAQLCKLSILLQRGCKTDNAQRLWWLSAALTQSIAINGVAFSATIASILSAIDRKIKILIDEGEANIADDSYEGLIKNILYYIAIADDRGRIVNQVKQIYALNEQIPEINELEELRQQLRGPSSEVLIAVSNALLEDVASAKDCIELFMHSEFKEHSYLDRLLAGLHKIGDTLSMIGIDEYREKIGQQAEEVRLIKDGEQDDIDLGLLSVSETILEVETCINNFIEYRINFQSNEAQESENGSNQFESRFSSNEHMAAFNVAVSEALLRIEQVKELLTEVVHIEYNRDKCWLAIRNLEDISGVISVIDLDAPRTLLEGICKYISSDHFKQNIDDQADILKDLADCIVSLQCYFEQIELRVPYAEQILDYSKDALAQILGQEHSDATSAEEDAEQELASEIQVINPDELGEQSERAESTQEPSRVKDLDVEQNFDQLPDLNALVEDQNQPDFDIGQMIDEPDQSEEITSIEANPVERIVEKQEIQQSGSIDMSGESKNKPEQDNVVPILSEDFDPEVLETYIEEATQVIFDMKQHWDKWKKNQQDWQNFIELRRGFHTLKGSGRFAGAQFLGEFAWKFENLCNKLISKKNLVAHEKQTLLQEALEVLPQLVEQLKDQGENKIEVDIASLIRQAEELSNDANIQDSSAKAENSTSEQKGSEETLRKELTGIFSIEATQHLSILRDAIESQYEKSQQIRIDDELLRTIHTLRGSAHTAGAENISSVCAPLEDIVASAIKQKISFNEDQVQLVQSGLMQIELALQELKLTSNFSELDPQLLDNLNQLRDELETRHESNFLDSERKDDDWGSLKSADSKQEEMVDLQGGRDEELCEIFFEEAEDVLAACQSALQLLKSNSEDAGALSELRRQLHTLKGSSRMAGFTTIGELSHVTESLLVSLVDRRKEFTDDICTLLQRVVDNAHLNIEAAQAGQDIYLDQSLVNEVLRSSGANYSSNPVGSEVETGAENSVSEKVEEAVEDIPLMEVQELLDESNENGVKVQPDAEKQLLDELDENEVTVQSDAEKQLLDELNENEVTVQSDPEQQSLGEPNENEVTVQPDAEQPKIEVKEFISAEPSYADQDNSNREPIMVTGHSGEKEKREVIRVQSEVLDGLVNDAGEVNILHSRLEQVTQAHSFSINEFEQTVSRLREQLRKLEMETEAQILFKHAEDQGQSADFDPLELDRYSDIQQLSRALAESVEDLLNIKEMFSGYAQKWEDILVQQHVVTTSLQDSLLRTRMVRFESIEPRLQRIVRQISDELKKQVELNIDGGETEIDRSVLNRIIAPLEHILRNSIGHGIEVPEEREKNGKPAKGSIKIKIKRESSEIIIAIEDDGLGIDAEKVKAKAIEKGLVDSNVELNKDDILGLILKPGFSTADTVTQIAGRGVGMDVVDKEIRSLGGALKIQSAQGKGAIFSLRLPFTLAVSQALLVQAGQEIYALTLSGIEGVIRLSEEELKKLYEQQEPSYTYAGHEYFFYHLGSLLQSEPQKFEGESSLYPVLLVKVGEQRLALQVEASLGNKEIVVKPLASQIVRSQGISGATILGDGRVALILDIPWIARLTQTTNYADAAAVLGAQESVQSEEPTVMVVDDSITIRKVTTRFLERNHYKVVTAKDGVDALQKLQKIVPNMILLDIEMPRMDGYELAAQIRKDQRVADVPIIMITSRTGDKHRSRAMEVGVERYLGKPYNEAELLKHINELQAEHK